MGDAAKTNGLHTRGHDHFACNWCARQSAGAADFGHPRRQLPPSGQLGNCPRPRELGYNVTVVDQLPHRYMYPNFTGSSGFAATIDIVTGSDLPFNHIVYLGPTKYDPDQNPPWQPPANWQPKDWSVIGTTNEATDIILASASHTVAKTSDLETVPASFSRQIVGLDQDTCPACVKTVSTWSRPWEVHGNMYST